MGDDQQVALHRANVMRAYLIYLVGIVIFVDKSATYTDVVYLQYFQDFERIHEYNWGDACLIYLYSKLREGFIIDNSCVPNFSFQTWILQHFPRIFGWTSVNTYTEDMSCATAFPPLKRNQMTEHFRVYLDCLVGEEMPFNSYVDHHQAQPYEIVLYSEWLAYGSCLTAPPLPEHVMRQFGYTQTIPRHPIVSTPPALTCRQIDDMFDDYESHLVLEEAGVS
ncbi:uncharacterized protein LOC127104888 [Lathyrus oleraceus]|uniref:uncharacterized protein LOC127104888 n=1 Tax=Pisum sativum TaxID=3888 RepID=UPI0021CFD38F|nr:uncharacterized protein LOC127104888 [Pisum sativum]